MMHLSALSLSVIIFYLLKCVIMRNGGDAHIKQIPISYDFSHYILTIDSLSIA